MPKINLKIPSRMKWLFWSYDIKSLDIKDDKDYIVAQVLNYGTWEDLKWLYSVYAEKEIEDVVKNPRRGVWFEKVLNFWALMLDIRFKNR